MMIHQFDHGDCPKENEKINLEDLVRNSMNLELTEEPIDYWHGTQICARGNSPARVGP